MVNHLTFGFFNKKSSVNFASYERAFNNLIHPSLSSKSIFKHEVNHRKIIEKNNAFTSVRNIKERFSNKYSINDQIIYSHYIFNILNAYTD